MEKVNEERTGADASTDSASTSLGNGRRSFLGIIAGLIGAAITGVLGLTVARFAVGKSSDGGDTAEWTEAAFLEDIPDAQWVKRNVTVSQDAGWGRFNTQRPVWIFKKDGILTVFSATCPHLGCTINESQNGFVCPCHGSSWNANGVKLGGPTPRNMDTLQYRVNGDALEVKYQYFKQGVPDKISIS